MKNSRRNRRNLKRGKAKDRGLRTARDELEKQALLLDAEFGAHYLPQPLHDLKSTNKNKKMTPREEHGPGRKDTGCMDPCWREEMENRKCRRRIEVVKRAIQ